MLRYSGALAHLSGWLSETGGYVQEKTRTAAAERELVRWKTNNDGSTKEQLIQRIARLEGGRFP